MSDLSQWPAELGAGVIVLCTAFGLATACGLRVFLPLFLASLAAKLGWFGLHESFAWLNSTPALCMFGAATVMEVLSYHLPLLDHALDVAAVPAAAIAATIVSLAVLVDCEPWLRWSLALIAAPGVATSVRLPLAGTRFASTVTTAGIGNQVIAVVESVLAAVLSMLAVFLPLAVIPVAFLLLAAAVLLWRRIRRKRPETLPG